MAEQNKADVQKPASSPEKASGKAIGALVCGICTIVIGIGCCPLLWLPLGIVAMVLGKQEERAIAEGTSSTAGKALAQWGFWLGLVGLILGVLITILALIFGFFASFMDHWQSYRNW